MVAESDDTDDLATRVAEFFDIDAGIMRNDGERASEDSIIAAITSAAGHSGWIRQAPFALILFVKNPENPHAHRDVRYFCGSSLAGVAEEVLNQSPMYDGTTTTWDVQGDTALAVPDTDVYVGSALCSAALGKRGNRVLVPGNHEPTKEDVIAFARTCLTDENIELARIEAEPTAEVEYAAVLVARYESERLNAVRHASAAGVSQRTLSALLGVSQATVSRWLKEG